MSTQNGVKLSTEAVIASTKGKTGKALPPIHLWNPPYAGEIDIVIKRNGDWIHEGGKINRAELVRLFASILRKEDDAYFLVTPVEKVKIQVEDVPFIAVDIVFLNPGPDQNVQFETNVGDLVTLDQNHAIHLKEHAGASVPYVTVRDGLEARLDRKTYYRLIENAEQDLVEGINWIGLRSGGQFIGLMPADETWAD